VAPYSPTTVLPEAPELILNSWEERPEALADPVIAELERRGRIVTL
jgi:hypothetical protein